MTVKLLQVIFIRLFIGIHATVLLVACQNNLVYPEVYVKSYGAEIDERKPIQFYVSRRDGEDLENYSNRQKVIRKCVEELKLKRFRIVEDYEPCQECYVVFTSVTVEVGSQKNYVPSYQTPVSTVCSNYFGILSCSSYGGITFGGYTYESNYWSKYGAFSVREFNGDKKQLEEVRVVQSLFVSENSGISGLTAEYLCRGFVGGLFRDVSTVFSLPDR